MMMISSLYTHAEIKNGKFDDALMFKKGKGGFTVEFSHVNHSGLSIPDVNLS